MRPPFAFRLTLLLTLLLSTGATSTQAQAPQTMSFQGRLELDGQPADTVLTLIFRLVDDTTAAPTTVWTETQSNVMVAGGLFNVILGSVTPLPSLEFSKPLWLEIENSATGDTFRPNTPLTASPYALGLVLPQVHDVSPGGTALVINNLGNADAIKGETQGSAGRGLYGQASAFVGQNYGVYGLTSSREGTGVYGIANTAVATHTNYGVRGESISATGVGVYGTAPKMGVYGVASTDAVDAYGVYGTSSTSGLAVYGLSSGTGRAVFGHNTGSGEAGHFEINNGGSTANALRAFTNGDGPAGSFEINNAGSTADVIEATTNGTGNGVTATGGAYGVRGTSTAGFGVGVSGETATSTGIGVRGIATATTGITYGVYGESDGSGGHGVHALGDLYGTYTEATADGTSEDPTAGLYAKGFDTFGGSYAGIFDGRVLMEHNLRVNGFTHFVGAVLAGDDLTVNEDLDVLGNLDVTGSKNFKIDHPLDPANRYLRHFAIESSQVLNVYSGNVTTDEAGFASVTMPDWFDAINRDFRYQLTVIGSFARAIIAEEMVDGRFVIQTDEPNVKVSWQVTAVRSDPHLLANPPVVEGEKPDEERGTFLSPVYRGR